MSTISDRDGASVDPRVQPTRPHGLRAGDAAVEAGALALDFAERAAAYDASATFPVADLQALRERGFLGLLVPEHLGGSGATFEQYALVAYELGRGNASSALCFNMHASVTGALAQTPDALLSALGATPAAMAARDRFLRDAARGALFGVAMSERGAGARLSKLSTTYAPCARGWHLRGEKSFVTGAGHADAYLVAARALQSDEGSPRVSYFLVPAGAGVEVRECWDALGMRASASHDLVLDVEVTSDALLGGIEGLALLLAQVMPQWLVASYAAIYVGVAAAIDAAVALAKRRGLDRLPAVRARIGRADAETEAARLAVLEAARRVDEAPGTPATNRAIWRAKLLAGTCAAEVASSMLEAAGSAATRRGEALERLYRDARLGSLQPATSDVCADWLGIAALGGEPGFDANEPRW